MYIRRPDRDPTQVKIPENYSGHAFRETRLYSDMPPPTRIDTAPSDKRSGDVQQPPIVEESEEPALDEEYDVPTFYVLDEKESLVQEEKETPKPSIFSSLLPTGIGSSDHFPFGHGIGSEELLILAIMLLVYISGEEKGKTDTEFLLMLGLLLFAG